MISKSKDYCIVILKAGTNENLDEGNKILWEHARINFTLRADELLPIICRISDESNLRGMEFLMLMLMKQKG